MPNINESSENTDIFTAKKRSEIMSRVKGKNTKPELMVRSQLHRAGFRFRLHRKDLPGKPDIVLPRLKTVIFVHGCFWHQHPGCRRATLPKQNAEFWKKKMAGNVARDEARQKELRALGWRVEVLWQCRLETDLPQLIENLRLLRSKD